MNSAHTIKFLKFPFRFEVEKLQAEVTGILQKSWIPHFNQDGYSGEWKSLALYSADGKEENIIALNEPNLIPTGLLKNGSYLGEVIHHFECPITSARLLRLGQQACIKPHKDYNLGYENGTFRIHVPIFTNPYVRFVLDGTVLEMQEGQCWYTNVNYLHSVSNEGMSDRIHLVIDYQRNDWSDRLFFSLAPRERLFPNEGNQYSAETVARIIDELKLIDSEGARTAILELENSLARL